MWITTALKRAKNVNCNFKYTIYPLYYFLYDVSTFLLNEFNHWRVRGQDTALHQFLPVSALGGIFLLLKAVDTYIISFQLCLRNLLFYKTRSCFLWYMSFHLVLVTKYMVIVISIPNHTITPRYQNTS